MAGEMGEGVIERFGSLSNVFAVFRSFYAIFMVFQGIFC